MIAAVILGAGLSLRLGRPKQLLWLGGKTIIEQVTENVLQTEVSEVIVVVGAHCQEVEHILKLYPVKCRYNPRYQEGIGTSVAAGAAAVAPHVQGIMFVVGDQPLLSSEYMNQMLKCFMEKKPLILKPEKGMPAIFAEELRQELIALTGDIGGRQLIDKYREQVLTFSAIPENESLDIDTQEDYQRVLEMWRLNGG